MRYNPNTYGLEGSQEKRESLVNAIINLRLVGKMTDKTFRKILQNIKEANKF